MRSVAAPDRQRVVGASGREHLLTVVFGLWMTVGLFLDGYFHQNLDGGSEAFLTPWHGVFYAGFVASALWLATMSRRRSPTGADWRLAHLPPGYERARLGLILFAIGGAGDTAWHAAFGVERGVDALLSPTHLLLFVGLLLILTAPMASTRTASPSTWTVVASLTSATALVGFFVNFAWGLGSAAFTQVAYDPDTGAGETQVIAGVASTLVTTAVLFTAARLLLRGGRPPLGAFTVLFGVVALLVSVAFDEDAEGVVAATLAGLALDVLVRASAAGGGSAATMRVAFGAAAGMLWLLYFGLLGIGSGLAWQAEIWLGSVVLSVLAASFIATIDPSTQPDTRGGAS